MLTATTLRLERSVNGKLGCRLRENLVSAVDEGSTAATAGLCVGQVIKSVNGRLCTKRQGASDLLQLFMQQSVFTFTLEVEEQQQRDELNVTAAPPPLKKKKTLHDNAPAAGGPSAKKIKVKDVNSVYQVKWSRICHHDIEDHCGDLDYSDWDRGGKEEYEHVVESTISDLQQLCKDEEGMEACVYASRSSAIKAAAKRFMTLWNSVPHDDEEDEDEAEPVCSVDVCEGLKKAGDTREHASFSMERKVAYHGGNYDLSDLFCQAVVTVEVVQMKIK